MQQSIKHLSLKNCCAFGKNGGSLVFLPRDASISFPPAQSLAGWGTSSVLCQLFWQSQKWLIQVWVVREAHTQRHCQWNGQYWQQVNGENQSSVWGFSHFRGKTCFWLRLHVCEVETREVSPWLHTDNHKIVVMCTGDVKGSTENKIQGKVEVSLNFDRISLLHTRSIGIEWKIYWLKIWKQHLSSHWPITKLHSNLLEARFKYKQDSKEGTEKQKQRWHIENNYKMVNVNPITSIITLNVDGLNPVIKRQRLSSWNGKIQLYAA